MGYQMDGTYEGELSLTTTLNLATCILQFTVMLLSILLIGYFIARRPLGKGLTPNCFLALLFWSLTYQILQAVFLYSPSPPLVDWCYGFTGVTLMWSTVLIQMNVLRAFKAIAPGWTDERITRMQQWWCVVFCVLYGGGLAKLGFIGTQNVPLVWADYGITLIAALCSIYDAFQSIFVTRLLNNHFSSISGRMPPPYRIWVSVGCMALFDWIGLTLFALGTAVNSRATIVLGILVANVHIWFLLDVFFLMRSILIEKSDGQRIEVTMAGTTPKSTSGPVSQLTTQ
ncbi:hypothetical protein EDD86DRAFT_260206 [Gorgonomyces haynaldii]|nr:hypothetical protein EDD86DRAFT_260206 [Gorgonomyces haynaldii]